MTSKLAASLKKGKGCFKEVISLVGFKGWGLQELCFFFLKRGICSGFRIQSWWMQGLGFRLQE